MKDINDMSIQTLKGHKDWVRSVAFSPDGKTIASGSCDNIIKIWTKKSDAWELIQDLTGHKDCIYSVAFSPDGKIIVSGSWDKTIKIWRNPLWLSESIFTDLHSLNPVQQKKIKEMCKPSAPKKKPFNDMKIFFAN